MLAWLEANWKEVLLGVMAVDTALIPFFPNAKFLSGIQSFLAAITGSAASK